MNDAVIRLFPPVILLISSCFQGRCYGTKSDTIQYQRLHNVLTPLSILCGATIEKAPLLQEEAAQVSQDCTLANCGL